MIGMTGFLYQRLQLRPIWDSPASLGYQGQLKQVTARLNSAL